MSKKKNFKDIKNIIVDVRLLMILELKQDNVKLTNENVMRL